MAQAIFGLIGVVVGGLLTAGIQALETWRQRRLRERTAARILYDEFAWWNTSVSQAVRNKDVNDIDPPEHIRAAWATYREDLSRIGAHEWNVLHVAVRASDAQGLEGWPSNAESVLELTSTRVDQAVSVLRVLADESYLSRRSSLKRLESEHRLARRRPAEADSV